MMKPREEYVGNGLWKITDEFMAGVRAYQTWLEPTVTIQRMELLPGQVSVLREALTLMQETLAGEMNDWKAGDDLDGLRTVAEKEFAVKFMLMALEKTKC
ncbi:hypothetical protein GFL93_12900 [Rhizobium leguminosarum bv. viciae]|uniref:hypothetical protein n=1 Tax=Rhizobium TaxID=379 RepID=UPI001442418F|nr:hypothetical protein [Rhizobium leguminosarum]NKK06759.1 hypothetical protein [Rhizobium leguminosarum bv. viciae]